MYSTPSSEMFGGPVAAIDKRTVNNLEVGCGERCHTNQLDLLQTHQYIFEDDNTVWPLLITTPCVF